LLFAGGLRHIVLVEAGGAARFLALLDSKVDRALIARKIKRTVSAIGKRRGILNKRRLVDPGLKVKT